MRFLSTLSLRRATKVRVVEPGLLNISIHALLAESDSARSLFSRVLQNFYPRSPCGERRRLPINDSITLQFLSTLSLRRATHAPSHSLYLRNISIHALLAESDTGILPHHTRKIVFLSTLSLRRATGPPRGSLLLS